MAHTAAKLPEPHDVYPQEQDREAVALPVAGRPATRHYRAPYLLVLTPYGGGITKNWYSTEMMILTSDGPATIGPS